MTPLDTQILDLGLGYARSHTRGVVCALSDSAIIAAENAVRTFADNIGCKVLHCETTYLSTDDDLAFLLSDLAKTSSFPNSSSHRGHADKILYVGKDGSRVSTHQGRIIVNSPHELHKVSVPCNLIERIVMEGNVSLTAGAQFAEHFAGLPVLGDAISPTRRSSWHEQSWNRLSNGWGWCGDDFPYRI